MRIPGSRCARRATSRASPRSRSPGVSVALAGVILTSIRGVRQDMARLESRLDGKIDALSAQLCELRERMAHLEGLMDGLREAIVGRAKPASHSAGVV